MWKFHQGVSDVSPKELAVTSSRVMMLVYYREVVKQRDLRVGRILVWDWKTGDPVRSTRSSSRVLFTSPPQMLSLPCTDGGTMADEKTSVTFLDEFRVMVLAPKILPDVLEFTLFDTLDPRGYPVKSQRFCLPSRYRNWTPSMHVDGDRCLGTLDRDKPLTTDPTQAILVVKLVGPSRLRVLLIVRVRTLIDHVRSKGTGARVPWDIWGRGTAVIEVPMRSQGNPYPLVQGVHVIIVEMYTRMYTYITPGVDENHHHPHLCIFDLSKRGRSALPLWGEGGGTERRVLYEDGRKLLLQGGEGMVEWGFDPLGDGKFMYLVSRFCRWKCGDRLTLQSGYSGSGGTLHVWEMV